MKPLPALAAHAVTPIQLEGEDGIRRRVIGRRHGALNRLAALEYSVHIEQTPAEGGFPPHGGGVSLHGGQRPVGRQFQRHNGGLAWKIIRSPCTPNS